MSGCTWPCVVTCMHALLHVFPPPPPPRLCQSSCTRGAARDVHLLGLPGLLGAEIKHEARMLSVIGVHLAVGV